MSWKICEGVKNSRGGKFPNISLKFFHFLDFGVTTGRQIDNNCSFNFNSNETFEGFFQWVFHSLKILSLTSHSSSPNFPGNYPINIECNYFFNALERQKVELTFLYFDVEGVFPCDEHDSASDSVEISNYDTRDRKHKFYCGKVNFLINFEQLIHVFF